MADIQLPSDVVQRGWLVRDGEGNVTLSDRFFQELTTHARADFFWGHSSMAYKNALDAMGFTGDTGGIVRNLDMGEGNIPTEAQVRDGVINALAGVDIITRDDIPGRRSRFFAGLTQTYGEQLGPLISLGDADGTLVTEGYLDEKFRLQAEEAARIEALQANATADTAADAVTPAAVTPTSLANIDLTKLSAADLAALSQSIQQELERRGSSTTIDNTFTSLTAQPVDAVLQATAERKAAINAAAVTDAGVTHDAIPVDRTAEQPPATVVEASLQTSTLLVPPVDPHASTGSRFVDNFIRMTDPAATNGAQAMEPLRFVMAEKYALGLAGRGDLTEAERMTFQQFLKDTLSLGDDFLVDGKFGTQTRRHTQALREVVREQQVAAGLTGADADGLAGVNTLNALRDRPATVLPVA